MRYFAFYLPFVRWSIDGHWGYYLETSFSLLQSSDFAMTLLSQEVATRAALGYCVARPSSLPRLHWYPNITYISYPIEICLNFRPCEISFVQTLSNCEILWGTVQNGFWANEIWRDLSYGECRREINCIILPEVGSDDAICQKLHHRKKLVNFRCKFCL